MIGPHRRPKRADASVLAERTRLFNAYKDIIDEERYARHFDSRSNLHSSVLEEFMEYLFRDLARSYGGSPVLGKTYAFKDLFFFADSFAEMLTAPNARIEAKDHDFAISVRIDAELTCADESGGRIGKPEKHTVNVPAVAIECKTYLDKTMLEGSSTAAEQLQRRNPNALYIVVMEWIKLADTVNLRKYRVDQIYILRKQRIGLRETSGAA